MRVGTSVQNVHGSRGTLQAQVTLDGGLDVFVRADDGRVFSELRDWYETGVPGTSPTSPQRLWTGMPGIELPGITLPPPEEPGKTPTGLQPAPEPWISVRWRGSEDYPGDGTWSARFFYGMEPSMDGEEPMPRMICQASLSAEPTASDDVLRGVTYEMLPQVQEEMEVHHSELVSSFTRDTPIEIRR